MSKELERLKEMIKIMDNNIDRHYVDKIKQASQITDESMAIRQLNYLEDEQFNNKETIKEFKTLAEKFL